MHRFVDYLIYCGVRIFICVIQALSLNACHQLAKWIAWLASDVLRIRHRVIDDNLAQVLGQLSPQQRKKLARDMWEHLLLMVFEIAHVPRKVHETNWREFVRFTDRPRMVRYLLDERPLIFVTGHIGNFEVGGYMSALFGFPTFTVARPLDNAYINRWVNDFRSAKGQYILPKQGSAGDLQRVLDQGKTIVLLGDQHAGPRGCWVDFLGRQASCHKAVALFTLTADAPMMVVYNNRSGRPLQFEMGVVGVTDPHEDPPQMSGMRELTQWYNLMLAKAICRAPEQYWWIHRRWKEKPVRKKKKPQPLSEAA